MKASCFMTSISGDLAYLTRVASRAPALTRDDEFELARRVRNSGDKHAADKLVRAHLRMVIALAIKYRHYGIAVSELAAEGNCGMVAALSKFDPERGIRFGTYAKHWVRAYILACVVRSSSVVGGSTGPVGPRLFFKLRRERARITAALGEGTAADEALAQRLNVSVEQLRVLTRGLDARGLSLDAPPSQLPHDVLVSSDSPEESYFRGQRSCAAASAVTVALSGLDVRERYIAEHRIMATADELSLAEIARTLGISRERARQLEARAKQKLGRTRAINCNSSLHEWLAD
jgi:RNA polymerase sigma-32 factor